MNSSIIKALESLQNNVIKSELSQEVKNTLIFLLDKLVTYYTTKKQMISKHGLEEEKIKALFRLDSEMTDYIVAINDILAGKNEPYGVTNFIYKEINYDKKKGRFKIKRLI